MKTLCFLAFLLFGCTLVSAQTITGLDQVLDHVLGQSEKYRSAEIQLNQSMASNAIFGQSYYPSIYTSTTFPLLSKSVTRITTPDGSDIFVNQNQAYYDLSINVEQREPLFGGTFVLSSFLNRIDLFGDINNQTFFATPFSLSYSNANFFSNTHKHEKTINQYQTLEDQITFNTTLEGLVLETVQKYLEAFLFDRNMAYSQQALVEQQSIYDIAKQRFEIGSITKGDLLSLELNLIGYESSIANLLQQQNETNNGLLTLLKVGMDSIAPPDPALLNLQIDYSFALDKMIANNNYELTLKRKLEENELELKNLNSDKRFEVGINAYFGLSNTADNFSSSVQNLRDQQTYAISARYLLFDFGKTRQKETVLSFKREEIEQEYQIEMESLKNQLYNLVTKYNTYKNQLDLQEKRLAIAKDRYEFQRARFSLGKVTINDLTLAEKEYRSIDQEYLELIKNTIITYFTIRKLTLYDFLTQTDINYL